MTSTSVKMFLCLLLTQGKVPLEHLELPMDEAVTISCPLLLALLNCGAFPNLTSD